MKKLENKIAIVTGGGKGIGRAIAHRFSKEGAKVAIWEKDQEAGSKNRRRDHRGGWSGDFDSM